MISDEDRPEDSRHDVLDVAERLVTRNNEDKAKAIKSARHWNWWILLAHLALTVTVLIVVLIITNHLGHVLSYDHTQTINQAKESAKEPSALNVIVDRVVCPIVKSGYHITKERLILIKQYCTPIHE